MDRALGAIVLAGAIILGAPLPAETTRGEGQTGPTTQQIPDEALEVSETSEDVVACLFMGTGQRDQASGERAGFVAAAELLEEAGIQAEAVGWGKGILSYFFPKRAPAATACLARGDRRILAGYSLGVRAAMRHIHKNEDQDIDVLFLVAPMGKKKIVVSPNVGMVVVAAKEMPRVILRDPDIPVVRMPLADEELEPSWWDLAPVYEAVRQHMLLDNHPASLDLLLWLARRLQEGSLPDRQATAERGAELLALHAERLEAEEDRGDDWLGLP